MSQAAKQTQIPGTERTSIPEVEEAAVAYRTARDERMAMQENETALQAALVEAMTKHGCEVYKYTDDDGEDMKVFVIDSKKAKVKKVKAPTLEVVQ
jgi:hypothetical protein